MHFVALPDISDYSYNISATFGGFHVAESSVTLLDLPAFIDTLIVFERTRQGGGVLSGTYDFSLELRPHEHRGDALVTFSISRLLPLPAEFGRFKGHGRCRLDGAFVIEGERVSSLVKGIERLLPGNGA